MIRTDLLTTALLAVAVLAGGATAASADSCMVSDPTGTPLNVRDAPNGKVVGTLKNGSFVVMRDTVDVRGKRWAELQSTRPGGSVYVYREYVSCR
jgi:hypothetical protein